MSRSFSPAPFSKKSDLILHTYMSMAHFLGELFFLRIKALPNADFNSTARHPSRKEILAS
jgi:hypothetical protein